MMIWLMIKVQYYVLWLYYMVLTCSNSQLLSTSSIVHLNRLLCIYIYMSGLRIPGPPPHGMVPQAHALGNTGHGTIHTYMHASIHPYLRTYIHTQTDIHTYLPTYIPTYLHTYIPTCIHTYIHTYIPTYQHTYQHTNIPTYHHHRPQGGWDQKNHTTTTGHRGGGPEEPYRHPRPPGGGPWGGGLGVLGHTYTYIIYRNISQKKHFSYPSVLNALPQTTRIIQTV